MNNVEIINHGSTSIRITTRVPSPIVDEKMNESETIVIPPGVSHSLPVDRVRDFIVQEAE